LTLTASSHGPVIRVEDTDMGVYCQASRIRESDDGIEAELLIEADLQIDGEKHRVKLNHSRVNLLNDGQKQRLQIRLQEVVTSSDSITGTEKFSWASTVPNLCSKIAEQYRVGIPAVSFSERREISRRSWLIRDFILKGVPNILWAEGGSCKSYLSLLSSCLIARGMTASGLHASMGNVLYLDWEEDEELFYTRMIAVQRGLKIADPYTIPNMMYKKLTGSLAGQVEDLISLIDKNNINFCVIDSVGAALGGNGIEAQPVEELFDAMGILGVTSLLIDHARKGGDDMYGSIYKGNRARQVRKLKKVQVHGSDLTEIMIQHDKGNDTNLKEPMSFLVKFDNKVELNEGEYFEYANSVVFEPVALDSANSELQSEYSVPQIVRNQLARTPTASLTSLAKLASEIKGSQVSESDITESIARMQDINITGEMVSKSVEKEIKRFRIKPSTNE